MQNIGVITRTVKTGNFFKDFFSRFKYKILPVSEYGFNFVFSGDNYSRVFKKFGVEYVVASRCEEAKMLGYKIIDGTDTYKKMLPDMVRKTLKSDTHSSVVAIVDRCFSNDCEHLADKLLGVCNSLVFVTEHTEEAAEFCENLMERYGTVAEVVSAKMPVRCNVAAVLENCGASFEGNPVVFDMKGNHNRGAITDFFMPFKVKPPEGISNLVYADCIEKCVDKV